MIRLERTVSTQQPVDKVYAYLSDFTTSTEWDPGSIETVLTKGDGGVGSEYHNTSKFAGRKTEITYVMQELVANERIALRGENKSVVAHDEMLLRETATGTDVVYSVEFEFQGVGRYLQPLMQLPLKKLLDDGQRGMERALSAL